jgi:hypothetical protein
MRSKYMTSILIRIVMGIYMKGLRGKGLVHEKGMGLEGIGRE